MDTLSQFHALPEEVADLAKNAMNKFGLRAVAMSFFPFRAVEVNPDQIDAVFANESKYSQLALLPRAPILEVRGQMDFLDKNPDFLNLAIERVGTEGLRQSSLSGRTFDPEIHNLQKKIARLLKAVTKAGVVVRNPDTGASAWERIFRYTEGAKALSREGVRMLPVAGSNVIEFPSE